MLSNFFSRFLLWTVHTQARPSLNHHEQITRRHSPHPFHRHLTAGTTARIREKQKAGDFAGMAAQVSDDHVAAFATESTWDMLADTLIDKAKKLDPSAPKEVLQDMDESAG